MNKKMNLSFSLLQLQKHLVFVAMLCVLVLTSCSNNSSDEESSEAEDATTILECSTNLATSTTAFCINKDIGNYVYTDQFGGRYSASSNVINATAGDGSVSIPTGWYATGGTVNFSDADITATAVKTGITLFGAAGSLATVAEAACVLSGGGGLRGSDCSAAVNTFFYTTDMGGRSNDCTNEGTTQTNASPCWVDAPSFKISTTPPVDAGGSNITCAIEGQQGSNCKGTNGTYYYTQPYGGRSLECNIGFNSDPCWLQPTGYIVSLSDGSTACTDNSLNNGSCDTQPGRYVYAAEYGGRSATCTNDSAGNCFVTQSTKQLLESQLVPDKIRTGVIIFGITGTYSGNGDWGSGAHRNIDTPQIGSAAEAGQYAANGSLPNLPAGYRSVPKIATDDEGKDTSNGNVEPVDRTGWGTTTCGLTQATIIGRISDCSFVFGTNARWNGANSGNAGQGIWQLVSRSNSKSGSKGREVWRDERTGMLWSSIIGTATNWCKAAASSNATNVSALIKEADPSSICDSATYQNQTTAISGCFEGTGFTTTDASIDNAGKVGMDLAGSGTSPKVAWRLPTLYDYDVADANGIRFVLPDMGANGNLDEWTSTIYSSIRSRAWVYNGAQGAHDNKARTSTLAFRCVGR